MSCKTFNLKSCEIRGATYQGRKIDFVNKVITQDTFTAKVYDEQGYLLTEIIGLKSGSVVYFPFTAIQNLSKDKYRIKYWADFYLLGTIPLGEEELTIGNTCPNCEVDDSTLPFVLELGTETIDFTLQLVYIAIGDGGGEVDLSEYLKKEDAILKYARINHTHSYNDLADLPIIKEGIQSIQEGSNITIDNTDPDNPIISSQAGFNGIATSDSTTVSFTGDGTISNPLSADSNSISVTKTSELNNDGADGVNPFITANDVPNPDLSGYATTTDLNAEIVNRELADNALDAKITTEKNRNDNQDLEISKKLNKPLEPNNIPSRVMLADGTTKPLSEITTDLSGYLQKPTTDGTWVVTRTGGVSGYTDSSTLGKNIFNSNLTLDTNRTQDLGGKTLYFTGSVTSKFKLDYLFLEPQLTPNSIPNKSWTDGVNAKFTDANGINYTLTNDLQGYKTISANTVIDNSFHRAIIIVTATCLITLPNNLRADLNFVVRTYKTATLTFANGVGATISTESNGLTLAPSSMCSVIKIGVNNYLLSGTE